MTRRSLYLLFSALLVLALALSACAAPAPAGDAGEADAPAAEAGAESEGDEISTLVIAIAEDTVSYDPQRAFETLPTIVHKGTYETLVTFPDNSVETIVPELAESWEISEDGTVYTFTLEGRTDLL